MKHRFIFLLVSYHTVNFFKSMIKKLLERGHEVRVLAIHDLPFGAKEDKFDTHRCDWHRFEWDKLEDFDPTQVIIFNGYFRPIHAASQILREKYHTLFTEVAWFTQNDYVYMSSDIHQKSLIAQTLHQDYCEVNDLDEDQKKSLDTLRSKYLPNPIKLNLPENFVLVPLQLERDTSILYASKYFKDMNSFVGYVKKGLGRDVDIVVKAHPKMDTDEIEEKLNLGQTTVVSDKAISMNDLVYRASMVIGINSTSLMEAMIHYKPVVQLGENIALSSGRVSNVNEFNSFEFSQPGLLKEYYNSIKDGSIKVNIGRTNAILLHLLANQIDFRNVQDWVIENLAKGLSPYNEASKK